MVANRQLGHHRHPEIEAAFAQHLVKVEAAFSRLAGAAIGGVPALETAEAEAGQLLQGAAEPPLGEHALDPIGGLAHVLEDQDGAFEPRQMGGAQQMGGDGEIGHQQWPFGAAAVPADSVQSSHRRTEQQIPQPFLAPGRLGGQGGEHRPVHAAAEALADPVEQQGGDVGEAQQPARGLLQWIFQQAGRAPAATDAGQQGGLGLGCWARCHQIGQPFWIAAGQVAPAALAEGQRVTDHLQPPALQDLQARLQAVGVLKGRAGGHQSHPIAAAQGGRQGREGGGHQRWDRIRASSSRPPSFTWLLKWWP